jgi:hypothetical protein
MAGGRSVTLRCRGWEVWGWKVVQLPEFAPGAVRAEGCGPWHKIALGCGGLLVLGAPLVDEAPVQTGGFDFDTVYALFSRGFMDESEGTLGARIVYDGAVVKEARRPPGRAT